MTAGGEGGSEQPQIMTTSLMNCPFFGRKFALGWGCRLEGQEGNKEQEVEKRRFVFLIQSTYNRYVLYFLNC